MMLVVVLMAVGWQWNAIGLAGPGAFVVAELAGLIEPFDMVVMAVLGSPHFRFKTQHLLAVLAERAIHGGVAADHLSHPLHEGFDH